jgi:addiction module RelE/StbE family toxin
MILRWTTPARRDLIAILDYISDDDPAAALAVIDRIEESAHRLHEFPLSGREGSLAETRELPIPGLPYLLVYRVRDASIEILRVLHGARQWPPR